MKQRVAIIGAGVSGLSCAVLFAERRYGATIFAEETGQGTTSAAAAAIWFPYDAGPADAVIAWSLETYQTLVDLSREPRSGVSMIELRYFARTDQISIPGWAIPLGAQPLGNPDTPGAVQESLTVSRDRVASNAFTGGFALNVPLMDTTRYLDYLAERFSEAGGETYGNVRFENLEDVTRDCDLIINCSGIGAKALVPDVELEPHRGQVVVVPTIEVSYAIACDDPPLMYAIPRTYDCVFGGTNEVSDRRDPDPAATSHIVAECSRALNIERPKVLGERVGVRPFRRSGVCLRAEKLRDGRTVIHNYGHGGSGFTLSWGCAKAALKLADDLSGLPA